MFLFTISPEITLSVEVIGIIVGACAVVIPVILFLLNRRIQIDVRVTSATSPPAFDPLIDITAANVGMRATSLGSVYLDYANRVTYLQPSLNVYRSAPDPYEISPGSPDLTIVVNGKAFAASLREETGTQA